MKIVNHLLTDKELERRKQIYNRYIELINQNSDTPYEAKRQILQEFKLQNAWGTGFQAVASLLFWEKKRREDLKSKMIE